MSFLFGGARPSGVDSVRDLQRQVTSSVRGTDREIAKQNAAERAIMRDLKRCGTESNVEAARAKARELIRLRAHRSRLVTLKSNMTGLAQRLGELHSTARTTETLAKTTRMLKSLNGRLDTQGVTQLLAQFQHNSDLMSNRQEMIDDTLESAFEVEGEAAATEDAMLAVFQEAGMDTSLFLKGLGVSSAGKDAAVPEADLQSRLQRLRSP